jgi:hypothetical protein
MSNQIYTKQPGDTIDIDIDLSSWLPATDTILMATAVADVGIVLGVTSINIASKTTKQWVSGGVTGMKYKVTVTNTSTEGRVKEVDFYIKVKEL